ncbi:Mediator complex subunit Med13 [Penicillium taxi]|uniref:Mediator complex subunit Med13 n=1 Tax=Penicillium taxi TaxID=168475 RepID=UPI0025456B0E|nr:Mediator complex subunit Med13 [Penicillium taxi]KAJ5899562.1 Mediator complex subunit Med13 [Penicillium taxi]
MEFPGNASTNVHLIDGFSTIYWRIYTEEPSIGQPAPEGPSNGYTILKHLGRLKDLEARLRNLNCLASCPRRLGLWVFSPTPDFESLASLYKEDDKESKKIQIESSILKGEIVLFDTLIIVGALPLGSRTLFTAIEKFGYENSRVDNESPLSTSCLTTLQVQLNAPGTLTISTQTISQAGIKRLSNPQYDIADDLKVQTGTDLWLSPSGTVARLVSANIESQSVPSPGFPPSGVALARRKQWKLDVTHWVANFGLHIDSIDEEPWVEVEVWEPFFARFAGEAWRQNDESQLSSLPLKRMLWPARFCFQRTGPPVRASWLERTKDDPLDFAEKWSSDASSLKMPPHMLKNPPILEEPQTKPNDASSPRADNLDSLESLSRMAQYPDLQNTSLVYPTPPEGVMAIGLNSANQFDATPDDVAFKLSPVLPQDTKNPELSPDIVIGTSRYDATDDEDLFGEINGRDFGSKGITDDDFNFFDDPDLENMDGETSIDQPEEILQPIKQSDDPEDKKVDSEELLNGGPAHSSIAADAVKEETYSSLSDAVEPEQSDGQMELDGSQSPPGKTAQTVSPPLSPVEIKKILFSGSQTQELQTSEARLTEKGHYRPVAFESRIGEWDQKYGSKGKFWFASGKVPNGSDQNTNTIPTIGLAHRSRAGTTSSTAKICNKDASPLTLESSFDSSYDSDDDSDDNSDEISLHYAPTPNLVILPSLKRKRLPSISDIQPAASPAKSSSGPDTSAGLQVENCTFLGNFLANFSDWSFIGYFSTLQIQQVPILLRREDHIAIAQIVVDQITQSSLDYPLGGRISLFGLESDIVSFHTCIEEASFLGEVVKLDLKGYTSLQEDTTDSIQEPNGSITKISAPHFRFRRGKEFLEALPPAVSFWETFGLEPAHGAKDVSAYCIHPFSISKAADGFLRRFGLTYESCHFGNHARGDKSVTFNNGLRSWEAESYSYASMMQSLKGMCEELGTDLAQASSSADTCVVYIVNPFPHAAALADVCAAFWHLMQQLVADADFRQAPQVTEVALQIIPMDFIVSLDSMVVPTQMEYLNLAQEVYNRCRPIDTDPSPLLCTPAVVLADTVPKVIHFRLASDKGSPLQDGRVLHIACSKSADQRWLSVAWTDGSGSLQTSMSYCLRYSNRGPARLLSEVRNEIWTTTRHIMDRYQARWKVILVNSEPIDPEELEFWTTLAAHQNKMRPGSIELIILAVSTIPDLVLELPVSPMTTAVLSSNYSSTPVSTPNPSLSVASPEQSGNAPTPGAIYNAPTPTEPSFEPDSELVLADLCDESWAVILSHRLNTTPHVTEFRPALASGYLLRRKGASDSDGIFSATINLIYSSQTSQSPPPEVLLKDIIRMYRDLASIARARGLRSVQSNTLPWHIATALRAQELLSYVF